MTSSELLSPPDGGDPVPMSFDGRDIRAVAGETVASALIAANRLMTSRSPKYRRPRGAFCLSGDCGTCLVRVDGQPNVRACMTPVAPGMRVESQNVFSPAALDPTQLVDTVFRSGFDHHTFMVKPRLVNQAMQTFARTLTGYGTLPDDDSVPPARAVFEQPEVCVVGCGKAGSAAADALRHAGLSPIVFDRGVAGTGDGDPAPVEAGVFAAYPGEHIIAASGRDPDGTHVLYATRPRHLVLAMGRRDVVLPIPNNDLPGVLSAHGLIETLEASGRSLACDVVVIHEDDEGTPAVDRLRALAAEGCSVTGVAAHDVTRIRGGAEVEGVETADKTIRCSLVAIASRRAAAYDLAAQAGCRVRFDGSGFVVDRDADGRAHAWGDAVTIWAAGGLCAAADSEADGRSIARAILAARTARHSQEGAA